MKYLLVSVVGLVAILGGVFLLVRNGYETRENSSVVTSIKNATYLIDGNEIQLQDGVSEISIPDSSSKISTRYFGNELYTDIDNDGREDVVFLVTQETGGSGVFYYVVAARNTTDGYEGIRGILLGDRIAPQSIDVSDKGIISVNYVDRNMGESFATAPSVGKSIWLKYDAGSKQFGEVAQNFEGEADSSIMTLTMGTWRWIDTVYSDGTTVEPDKADVFTLTFSSEDEFSATTDCNGVGGKYSADNAESGQIEFTDMVSTLMYCEGSQEADFTDMLESATSYVFTSKGELILTLEQGGKMTFR